MPKQCCIDMFVTIPRDEPVFTLRGKDILTTELVGKWIQEAKSHGVNEDKIARAQDHLEAIKRFQLEHPERCKLPD